MFTHYGINFDDKGTPIEDTKLSPWLKRYFREFNAPNGYIALDLVDNYFSMLNVCDAADFAAKTSTIVNSVMLKVFNNNEDKWETDFHYGIMPKQGTHCYDRFCLSDNRPFYLIRDNVLYKEA